MIKILIAFVIAIGLFGGAIYYVNQQADNTVVEGVDNTAPVAGQPYRGNVKTNPSLKYVGNSPDECSVIRFVCAEGQEYFANDNGCGCQDITTTEPVDTNPPKVTTPKKATCEEGFTRRYEANSLESCNLVDYMCNFDAGEKSFRDQTGCGCSVPDSSATCNTVGQAKNPRDPLVFNLVLGQETVINLYDVATLPNGDTLVIAEFINEPCTEVCIWSGQAIWFNWYKAGQAEPVRMPPYPEEFPYELDLVYTDYETSATITLRSKITASANQPQVDAIEKGIAWYIFNDHLSMSEYQNHCSATYGGVFESCGTRCTADGACPEVCQMGC